MNTIKLSGCVCEKPIYSHTTAGEKFYYFYIESIRKSGNGDTLKCIIPEMLVNQIEASTGIEIIGEVRTQTVLASGKKHCDVYVFVKEVNEYLPNNDYDENVVNINCYICKAPVYRRTPKGRKIADVVIASNRNNGYRSDYIPTIAWGRNALRLSQLEVGTQLNLVGRLQSREYTKVLENGNSETRTAYELSVMEMEVVDNAE